MNTQAYIVALPLAATLAASIALAQTAEPNAAATVAAIERRLVETIAQAERSVVAISRTAPQQPPIIEQRLGDVFGDLRSTTAAEADAAVVGSGVIIDPAGLVLTQYLAVREGEQHTITTSDGKRLPATIRAADPRSGLAVLEIKRGENTRANSFPAVRFAADAPPRRGQFVVVLGNPYAIEADGQPTASWGIITNVARKAPAGANLNDAPGPYGDHRTTLHHLGTLLQTDARLGWNAGGGPLVNLRGELLGITTTAAVIAGHEQPAGYAIPTGGVFRRVIETLKQGREVEYGMLGIAFGQAIVAQASQAERVRVRVAQVYPGGPAARAGLAAGDILTRIGQQPVDDVDAVQLAVSALPPGTKTTIAYQRDERPATTTVALAKLAVAGKTIATVRPEPWRGIRVDYATALDAQALAQAVASGALDAEGCVLVADVEPRSAGWRAGARPGMFISHVAGKRVTTPDEFRAAARSVGDELNLTFTQPLHEDSKDAPFAPDGKN